jgi:hypothetical protein
MAARLLAGLMGVLVIAIGIRYLWSGLSCRPSTRHGPVRARDGPGVGLPTQLEAVQRHVPQPAVCDAAGPLQVTRGRPHNCPTWAKNWR